MTNQTIAAATVTNLRSSWEASCARTDAVLVRWFGGHAWMAEEAAKCPKDWGKLGQAVQAEQRVQALYAAASAAMAWRAA